MTNKQATQAQPASSLNYESLSQEWMVLHNDIEKYERYSLLIKLASLFIVLFAFAFDISAIIAVLLIAIIWLQDGIWKTFQSRMSDRILLVERYIKQQANDDRDEIGFQYYSDWEKTPRTTSILVKEYMKNALRPTVAYPHAFFLLMVLIF